MSSPPTESSRYLVVSVDPARMVVFMLAEPVTVDSFLSTGPLNPKP